jgi:serine protease Do
MNLTTSPASSLCPTACTTLKAGASPWLGILPARKIGGMLRGALVAVAGGVLAALPNPAIADDKTATEASAAAELASAMSFSRAFEKVATDVSPAVVSITATMRVRQQLSPIDELFFGNRGPRIGQNQSFGSGAVVSADGIIMTNNHVVEGATTIVVRFADEREFPAKLIGRDPQTDIAILKIDAPGETFPTAKLGDTGQVKPGQWVLAIGSPFNLSHTVTAGIVSATGRSNVLPSAGRRMGQPAFEDFIQTDAAINPGNSGGPLVNLSGEVIGINTAIFSRTGGSVGIGFAVPINLARNVMTSILEDGRVRRPWLGIDMGMGMNSTGSRDGVLVESVVSDGPAKTAGIEAEDLITAINGRPVRDAGTLRAIVAQLPIDSEAKVDVLRGGQTLRKSVKIARMPEMAQAPRSSIDNPLGVAVEAVDEEDARALGLSRVTGAKVVEISPESVLGSMGLAPGAVILQINRQPISSVESFNAAVENVNLKRGVIVQALIDGVVQTFQFRG